MNRGRGAISFFGFWLSVSLSTVSCSSQVLPDKSVAEALRSLASRAGVVFVGSVSGIERKPGVVEISFAVERPVLGAVGGVYVLREWGGLWPPGQHRFRVGQRAMLFLHTAGRSSLNSPVDGMEGVVPVLRGGPAEAVMLDVRRLQTRLLRRQGAALPGIEENTISLREATETVRNWRREPLLLPLPRESAQIAGVANAPQ